MARRSARNAPVEALLAKDPRPLSASQPLADAVALLRTTGCAFAVVLEEGRPVGSVGFGDLLVLLDEYLRTGRRLPATVGEVMARPPTRIPAGATCEDALELLDATGEAFLAVVDGDGDFLGLVERPRLLAHRAVQLELERDLLERDLAARTRELVAANLRLQHESLRDHLLGIANRRAMSADLPQVHEMARRAGRAWGALLFDVDHFKAYNDHYGHLRADEVLRRITETLARALRRIDTLYRYGGEEILGILPETHPEGARTVAERARGEVEALSVPHAGAPLGVVTVSVGVCVATPGPGWPGCWQEVLRRADDALYRAKQEGRNRVALAAVGPDAAR